MAHFAKLGVDNKVEKVHRVSNDIATSEQAGIEFLQNLHKTNAVFKQTSYNTSGGVHYGQDGQPDDGFPLRKNYGGRGSTYDEAKDAFIPPKPYNSWTLNETTCIWEPPVPYPNDGAQVKEGYHWDEDRLAWIKLGI